MVSLVDLEKIRVISDFRAPGTKEDVRSFLGLIISVETFIPDLADTTQPLRFLLTSDSKFIWSSNQVNAFQQLKTQLSKIANLSCFDPKRPTRVVADASPVALGAVLLQFDAENDSKIVSFATKSFSRVEKRKREFGQWKNFITIWQVWNLNW